MKYSALPENKKQHAGFTIVETIVTILVLSLVLYGAFQAYLLLQSQQVATARQSIASDIAYTNLKKFPIRPAIASCAAEIDLKSYNGYADETTTTSPALSALGSATSVSQSIKAYPVDGCSGTNFVSQILKIVSTVSYSGGSISHATYVQ